MENELFHMFLETIHQRPVQRERQKGSPCKALHVPGNPRKFFEEPSVGSVEGKLEMVRECDVGGVVDGNIMSHTDVSRLLVDFSFRLPDFKPVLGEGDGSRSQLSLVVDAAVSQRVEGLVERAEKEPICRGFL